MKRRISEIGRDALQQLDVFVRTIWDSASPDVISASMQSIPRRWPTKETAVNGTLNDNIGGENVTPSIELFRLFI
jgi:hypothetical protein